jgi:hypothetical protein
VNSESGAQRRAGFLQAGIDYHLKSSSREISPGITPAAWDYTLDLQAPELSLADILSSAEFGFEGLRSKDVKATDEVSVGWITSNNEWLAIQASLECMPLTFPSRWCM